jgi:hypothetical protein
MAIKLTPVLGKMGCAAKRSVAPAATCTATAPLSTNGFVRVTFERM